MKNKILCILLISFFYAATANAQKYKMGLGVRLSSKDAAINNSISLKYFFSERTAVETLLSFGSPIGLGVLVEQHQPLLGERFQWLYGGGIYAGFGGDRRAGLQGIIGLDYKLPAIPFNLSLDWKPELNLSKELGFEPAAVGISARFTLK